MEFIRKGTNPKIFQGAARKLEFRKYENKLINTDISKRWIIIIQVTIVDKRIVLQIKTCEYM